MIFLEIINAGPYISVQDEGRPGYLRSGVSQGGAMDDLALEEGRLLVGNKARCAALEMLTIGGQFRVHGGEIFAALTGAEFHATVDGEDIVPRTGFRLQPGQNLKISAAKKGNYGYLSIAGGIECELVLGSRSTHVQAGFGGFEGRCVRGGDRLPIAVTPDQSGFTALPVLDQDRSPVIRILWGAQAELFSKQEQQRFIATEFEISHEINRMGARLMSDADPIHSEAGLTILSGAIVLGDIQVPGNGRPIVLLADRQPTGGYPRIATIIMADIARFAQLRPGTKISFTPVRQTEALEALSQRRVLIEKLPDMLVRNSGDPLSSNALLAQNLISGVVSMDALQTKGGNDT